MTDLVDLMLGECLGAGISREVYVLATNERYVVKLENAGGSYFSNVREWNIWNAASEIPWARKWLARCVHISDNGRVLVQERTATSWPDQRAPKLIPVWLTDFKPENYGWGLISSAFVCHDYANDLALGNGFSKRMRKLKWRFREVS